MFKSLSTSGSGSIGDNIRKRVAYEEYFSVLLDTGEWEDRYILLSENGMLYFYEEDDSIHPLNKEKPVTIKNCEFQFITDEDPPKIQVTPKEGVYTDPFVISLDDQEEMLPILQHLESLGGIRSSGKKSEGPRICEIQVNNWNTGDIIEWLKYIERLYNVEFYRLYSNIFNRIKTGQELLRETQFLGIKKEHKNFLDEGILELRRNGKVTLEEYVISIKLHRYVGDYGENHRNLVKILHDPNLFFRMYLNANHLRSKKASQFYVNQNVNTENFEFSVRFFLTDSSFMSSVLEKKKLRNPTLHEHPKAVVTSQGGGSRLPHHVVTRIGIVALVGPYLLEWNDSGIIVPILLDHYNTWIYHDTKPCFTVRNMKFEEMGKKLSLFCTRWNTKMTRISNAEDTDESEEELRSMNQNLLDYRSSLEFLQALYSEFKYRISESPNYCKDYLSNIHSMGYAPMVFSPGMTFRSKFGLITDQYAFDFSKIDDGHDKLVSFVKKLLKKDDLSFNRSFGGERKILRSFDRVFWMRWMKNPVKEKRFEKRAKSCVFENPMMGINYPKNYQKESVWKY